MTKCKCGRRIKSERECAWYKDDNSSDACIMCKWAYAPGARTESWMLDKYEPKEGQR